MAALCLRRNRENAMETAPSQLVVRQHERHTCSFPARGGIDAAQAEQVGIAVQLAGGGAGETACTLTDVSHGGLGLRSAIFLPKTTRLQLHVDLADGQPPVHLALKVMRVAMVDRAPTYYLGTSFVDDTAAIAGSLARLVAAAKASAASTILAPPAVPVTVGGPTIA